MEKSVKVVLFLSGVLAIVYLYLWIAIVPLIIVGLITGIATEGMSFVFCMWLAAKCCYAGIKFWPIALASGLLSMTLFIFCQLKG
jgi:hypothetical protein